MATELSIAIKAPANQEPRTRSSKLPSTEAPYALQQWFASPPQDDPYSGLGATRGQDAPSEVGKHFDGMLSGTEEPVSLPEILEENWAGLKSN
ncbi:hypothetical protein TWF281_007239 [Arthrobotrys megalospora]